MINTIDDIGLPILSGLALLALISILAPLAKYLRLIDQPDKRKRHEDDIPMVGGIAIYILAVCFTVILAPSPKLAWLVMTGSIIVFTGALDDAFQLGVRIRFASQVLATIMMMGGSSLWIRSLEVDIELLEAAFGMLGIPFTIFAVVGLTNGFNMADGIDGLASGHMLIGLMTLCVALYLTHGDIYQFEWLVLLMSTVFAFWLVNMSLSPVRKVFLGDAGSLLLGFVMAWILIYYTQQPISLMHPFAALWCVAIPVFDTIVVILARVKNHRSPFSSDRIHFHHVLIDLGMSQRAALVVLLVMSLVINVVGIWIVVAVSPLASLIAYGMSFLCFAYWKSKLTVGKD